MTQNLLDLMGDTGMAPTPVSSDAAPAPVQNKTEHVELELVSHYDNEVKGEILVSLTGHEAAAVWLSKSQMQFTDTGRTAPAWSTQGKELIHGLPVITANIPEWLAREKGLI